MAVKQKYRHTTCAFVRFSSANSVNMAIEGEDHAFLDGRRIRAQFQEPSEIKAARRTPRWPLRPFGPPVVPLQPLPLFPVFAVSCLPPFGVRLFPPPLHELLREKDPLRGTRGAGGQGGHLQISSAEELVARMKSITPNSIMAVYLNP